MHHLDITEAAHVTHPECGGRLSNCADQVLASIGDARRAVENLFDAANCPDLDARAARKGWRWRSHPPVVAVTGCLTCARERRTDHHRICANGERLGDLAALANAAVGNNRDVATAVGKVGITCGSNVAHCGDLRHADPKHLARRACVARSNADEDCCRPLLHERVGRGSVRSVADCNGSASTRNKRGELEWCVPTCDMSRR